MLYFPFIIFVICITLVLYIISQINDNKNLQYEGYFGSEITKLTEILKNNKRYKIKKIGYKDLCCYIKYKSPFIFDVNNIIFTSQYEKNLYYITEEKENFESFVKLLKKNELYKILEEKEKKGKYIVKYKYN